MERRLPFALNARRWRIPMVRSGKILLPRQLNRHKINHFVTNKKVPVTKNVTGTSIPAVPPYLACALFFLCWPLLTDTCVPANALQRLQPNVSLHHPHSLERFTTLLHRIYYTQYFILHNFIICKKDSI